MSKLSMEVESIDGKLIFLVSVHFKLSTKHLGGRTSSKTLYDGVAVQRPRMIRRIET